MNIKIDERVRIRLEAGDVECLKNKTIVIRHFELTPAVEFSVIVRVIENAEAENSHSRVIFTDSRIEVYLTNSDFNDLFEGNLRKKGIKLDKFVIQFDLWQAETRQAREVL